MAAQGLRAVPTTSPGLERVHSLPADMQPRPQIGSSHPECLTHSPNPAGPWRRECLGSEPAQALVLGRAARAWSLGQPQARTESNVDHAYDGSPNLTGHLLLTAEARDGEWDTGEMSMDVRWCLGSGVID